MSAASGVSPTRPATWTWPPPVGRPVRRTSSGPVIGQAAPVTVAVRAETAARTGGATVLVTPLHRAVLHQDLSDIDPERR